MAIYSAAHLIQLISASADVLLIRSRASYVSIGQEPGFMESSSLIYCLLSVGKALCDIQDSWPLHPVFRNLVAGGDFVGAGGIQVCWGPTRKLIRCPGCWRRIVLQNSIGSLDLWRTSSNTKSKNIRHPEQRCFRDALCRAHVNSAAYQHTGAHCCIASLLSMMSTFFVPIGKEIGDCGGTEHLPVFWRRAFRKAFTSEKRA